ncbi:MAG TPA: response regulator [Methylomirabilota bacterium]|jgi:CheY-like chemotaxis protein
MPALGMWSTQTILRTVLVVHDEPQTRSLLSELLTRCDYEVVTAANGAEAVAALRETPPDVVLLDLTIPGMSGLEVMERIQAARPSTPVIVLSGSPDDSAALGAVRMGAYAYLPKPFEFEHLQRLVASALAARS